MKRTCCVTILSVSMCLCAVSVAAAQMVATPPAPTTRGATSRPPPKPRTPTDAITPTTRPISAKQWIARHDAFVKDVKDHPDAGLLFIGDSITDFWRNRGVEVWKKFETYKPLNLGISGDQTQWVLWRLMNGELDGIHPKVVVIMIGTNNVGNNPDEKPEWAAAGVTKIVELVREKLPESKILLLAVFPRDTKDSAKRALVNDVNKIISRLDDNRHVFYLDIGDKFLDANGELPKEIMPDKLHPTTQGYEIWYDAMIGKIDELMK